MCSHISSSEGQNRDSVIPGLEDVVYGRFVVPAGEVIVIAGVVSKSFSECLLFLFGVELLQIDEAVILSVFLFEF